MQSRQARKRCLLLALCSAVFAAAFYGLIYLPQCDELSAKQAEATRLQREIAEASAFRRAHPSPEEDVKRLGERSRMARAMIPERLEEGVFFTEAEKYAAETGISLLGVASGEAAMAEGYTRKQLKLTVRGEYFALLDFLYALEQRGRFVKIDAVRGKTENGDFTGTVELWIYAQSQ